MKLFDYQREAKQKLFNAINNVNSIKKNTLLISPTGSGKTVIASHLMNESKSNQILMIVNKICLLSQGY